MHVYPYTASVCIGAFNEGSDARGPYLLRGLKSVIGKIVNGGVARFCKERVASTSGDGALVLGGDDHKHGAAGMMNLFWEDLLKPREIVGDRVPAVPKDRAMWDDFHAFSAGGR